MPYNKSFIDQARGEDGWILDEFSFYVFMDLHFISVHKNTKRELSQYPAILTSPLVNNIYMHAHFNMHHILCVFSHFGSSSMSLVIRNTDNKGRDVFS